MQDSPKKYAYMLQVQDYNEDTQGWTKKQTSIGEGSDLKHR